MHELSRIMEKIEDLETKLAFQEDTVAALNDVISKQDKEIQTLWEANRLLKSTLDSISSVPVLEQKPPHF